MCARLPHREPYRGNRGALFRIVIVVNEGRGGLRVEAKARTKLKIEFCSAGARPQIDDHTIGKDVVLADTPVRSFRCLFQRCAIDISAGWQTDFSQHHAVATKADPLSFNIWVELPNPWHRAAFVEHLRSTGLGVVASDAFTAEGTPPEAVRVCLGGPITRPRLVAGLEYMAHALTEAPALASAFL